MRAAILVWLAIILAIGSLIPGCDMQWGDKYVDTAQEYGEWESYLDVPSFLPDSIDDYQVNSYSYRLLAFMDICYEIFVDISVTEEQLDRLIASAKEHPDYRCEKEAYYADGYTELVFEDSYEIYHREADIEPNVGWADIEKIIYNAETLNVIYVCFHANDTGVYDLDDVAYFNRFSIQEEEYVASIE